MIHSVHFGVKIAPSPKISLPAVFFGKAACFFPRGFRFIVGPPDPSQLERAPGAWALVVFPAVAGGESEVEGATGGVPSSSSILVGKLPTSSLHVMKPKHPILGNRSQQKINLTNLLRLRLSVAISQCPYPGEDGKSRDSHSQFKENTFERVTG